MTLILVILIGSTLLGGWFSIFFTKGRDLRLPLIFAAAYLFTITVLHILPELYTDTNQVLSVSIFILAGFLLQQILEAFSSGIEHGHFHKNAKGKYTILIALLIHSILEGSLLKHDFGLHDPSDIYPLLFGIVLHKMPAALALMIVFGVENKLTLHQWMILLIFSLASPLGLVSVQYGGLNETISTYLFAVVCGSFLHISTTIFVESSPEHRFGWKKMAVSVLGAGLAFLSEYFI